MNRRWHRIVARISLLAFLASFAGTSAAAKASTKEMELRARKAFAAGEHRQALDLFAELYAETLHPVYLRNIARCHQKMGAPQEAIGSFRDYLAKAKKVDAAERREIDGYIREMEQLLEERRAQEKKPDPPPVAPPPATVSLAPVMPAQASTGPADAVTVQDGASEAPPFYRKWWFWTGIGAVVAGAVVTGVMLSGGGGKPACPSGNPKDCQ